MVSLEELVYRAKMDFDQLRAKHNKVSDSEDDWDLHKIFKENPVVGREWAARDENAEHPYLAWRTTDVLWVYIMREEWSYEGFCYQIGITRDGQFCYEYQDHCSCNWYENSTIEAVTKFSSIEELFNDLAKRHFNVEANDFYMGFYKNLFDMVFGNYRSNIRIKKLRFNGQILSIYSKAKTDKMVITNEN